MSIKKKIVLIDDSAIGKTSLIRRFVFNHFRDSYKAIIGSKEVYIELLYETKIHPKLLNISKNL
jgi:GTPase SAR1 family protein